MEENKKEKRPDTDLLQSILHNAEIGVCAIDYIMPEVESDALEKILKKQRGKLLGITEQAKELGEKKKIVLKPNNCFKKSRMWLTIKMSSFWEDSPQHLSEMLLLGYFMAVLNMIKSLADCSKAKVDIIKLARDLKGMEESSINELVPFLERTKR